MPGSSKIADKRGNKKCKTGEVISLLENLSVFLQTLWWRFAEKSDSKTEVSNVERISSAILHLHFWAILSLFEGAMRALWLRISSKRAEKAGEYIKYSCQQQNCGSYFFNITKCCPAGQTYLLSSASFPSVNLLICQRLPPFPPWNVRGKEGSGHSEWILQIAVLLCRRHSYI